MKTISLNGSWRLYFFAEGTLPVERPQDLARSGAESVEAEVPGNVELDLVRAGRLAEPYVGLNIYGLRELEKNEWWYVTTFRTPAQSGGKRVSLTLHGIDCFGTVWLNGERVAETDNMLIPWTFDVTEKLRAGGTNELAVRIGSPISRAKDHYYEPWLSAVPTNYEQLFVRKAPHMYGWDIAPRVVTAGLWRSVELEVHEREEFVHVGYATEYIAGKAAMLKTGWQFASDEADTSGYTIRVAGRCGKSEFDQTFQPQFFAGERRILVEGAELWWPRGYGEAVLYEVRWELMKGGVVVDRRTDTIGLRTVELERTERSGEEGQFLIRINGQPIMCKGSNWVPLDAFHSRDAQRCEQALELFDELGCNIIRCWGGNVYEDEGFFRHCDRTGMMVWQDFTFACALYPHDAEFLEKVRREAEVIVRKLRNHPSLILWAGDNELDIIAYLDRGIDPAYNRISRQVLPEVCAVSDPYRPYLPSSPYVSPDVAKRKGRLDQTHMPEQHLWGPRDYYKSAFYGENTAHFASEIGYHGCPNVTSLKRFIEAEHLWPWQDNDQWRAHAADPQPEGGPFAYRIKLMADQIKELFGFEPDNLEDFALASQISQGEAKKYFIELFRLRKWRKTGIIWWNVLDCWPQFSDAVVDYYFEKKLAYWYIRRVQAPVCVMLDEPANWHCRVVAGNDTLKSVEGSYAISDAESGETVLEGRYGVGANGSAELGKIRVSRGEKRLFLIRWGAEEKEYGNHYLLGTPPVDYRWYRKLLPKIAALPLGFEAEKVAK